MIITVTGRHLDVTATIKEHAQEKVQKLLKHYDLIKEIEVILDGNADKQKGVEILVSAEHRNMFVGTCVGEDLYACIDQAVHKLERQLTDHKERFRNRKHPNA